MPPTHFPLNGNHFINNCICLLCHLSVIFRVFFFFFFQIYKMRSMIWCAGIFLCFRSNFFVEECLCQTLTLYFYFCLQFVVKVKLLQCKFIEFMFHSPYISIFYFSNCFRTRIDFWCRLTQMGFTWVQILIHWSFKYSEKY